MIAKSNIVFKSKRNYCYYDQDKKCVVKKFQNEKNYFKEKTMLNKLRTCSDLRIPRILSFDDKTNSLKLEYIKGPLVLEQLEMFESILNINGAVNLLNELIKWLNTFYNYNSEMEDKENLINIIYGDVNLRNFIISEECIIGIDLEQCKIGSPIEEIEYMLAMFMLYNPIDSSFKRRVCLIVSHENNINISHIEKQMTTIWIRRKKHF